MLVLLVVGSSSLYKLDLVTLPPQLSLLKTPSLRCWHLGDASPQGPLLCSLLWLDLGKTE